MGDAANVLVGADGAVFGAPLGTTLPTDVDDALDVAFADLGFISDAGLVEGISTSTNKIKNWKGDTVRQVQTEHTLTYKFTMIETNEDTDDVYYGSAPSDGIKGEQGTRQSWVFDVFDGDETIRILVPDGQVTERGDVNYRNDQAIAYDVTVTAYPDDSNNKAYHFRTGGS